MKTTPLTVDLLLGLSVDMQIQRSVSKRKQIRNVMDNIELLHGFKHLSIITVTLKNSFDMVTD